MSVPIQGCQGKGGGGRVEKRERGRMRKDGQGSFFHSLIPDVNSYRTFSTQYLASVEANTAITKGKKARHVSVWYVLYKTNIGVLLLFLLTCEFIWVFKGI